jgi:hypothetical protein
MPEIPGGCLFVLRCAQVMTAQAERGPSARSGSLRTLISSASFWRRSTQHTLWHTVISNLVSMQWSVRRAEASK